MNAKQKGRWMKRIVSLCLMFCAAYAVASYVGKWFGVDTYSEMTAVFGLFGGELIMTLILELIKDRKEKAAQTKQNQKEVGNG